MKDTWNPAELNPEIAKVDSWNTAQLNNFVKRKDTWNPAELSEYINRKYNLEAEIDANIDDNTASFTVIEPDVIKEIKYTIDQEEGSASQLILLNDVMPAVKNKDVFNLRQFPTDSTGYSYEANPEIIGGSVVWNQLVGTNTESVTIPSEHKYILWNGSALSLATSDGTAVSVSSGYKFYDITQMFGTSVANQMTTTKFAELFPNYASYAYSAPTIQSTKVSAKVVKDANDHTVATYDLSGSHLVKRKYALVDLGTLTYTYRSAQNMFSASFTGYAKPTTNTEIPNLLCAKYISATINMLIATTTDDKAITVGRANNWDNYLLIRDTAYTDATDLKNALNGVYLLYPLATPTTEPVTNPTLYGIWKLDANNNLYFDGDTVDDIPNPMVVEAGGTEEYIDAAVEDEDRDVSLPVQQNIYWIKDCRTVIVPDPPETLTDAEVTIDKTGAVTIIDNSGEEPAEYTTSITPMDTLLGVNYITVKPGELTELKYTRIKPKPLAKSRKKTTKSKKED